MKQSNTNLINLAKGNRRLKGANGKRGAGIGRGEGTQEATNGESQDAMGLLYLLLCFGVRWA